MIEPRRTTPLTREELYVFDTTGLLRIPGFLHPDDLPRCRDEVFACDSRLMAGRHDKRRYDDLAGQSEELYGLAGSRGIRGCVEPLINQPYRLIESYGLYREKDSVFYLHNGASEHLDLGRGRTAQRNMSYSHTFHDDKLYCMFVKVLVYLSALRTEQDGPFCYLQGSHKANFSWFPTSIEKSEKPALTKANFPTLETLHVEAGDAVIINEALLHGTLPKTSDGDRVVMAFSYAPIFITDWKAADLDSDDLFCLGHF